MKYEVYPIFLPFKGCPFKCAYCNQHQLTGQAGDFPSLDTIRNKLEQMLKTGSSPSSGTTYRQIAYYGGTFTGMPAKTQDQLLGLGQQFIEVGRVNSLRISTRPDFLDKETLLRLSSRGVKTIEIGVQTLNEEILRQIGRCNSKWHYNLTSLKHIIEAARQLGVEIIIQIMPGLPGWDEKEKKETIEGLKELGPNGVRIFPTIVVEGTELERLYRQGSYKPLSLEAAVQICKDISYALEESGICVLKIGLQPSEFFGTGKGVVAGPFHPSLGHMVETAKYRDRVDELITELKQAKKVSFHVHPNQVSSFVGLGRKSLEEIKSHYHLLEAKVVQDPGIRAGDVVIKETS